MGKGLEGGGDGRVVGRGEGEGLLGEAPARGMGEGTGVSRELGDEGGVVGGGADDGNVLKVFCRRAEHGWAADVDVFDEFGRGDARLGGGFLKGVEVDDDHVDRLDRMGLDRGGVFGVAANVENAAVDLRVECFDAAVEHLGEAGEIGDVADGEPGLAKHLRGAAG